MFEIINETDKIVEEVKVLDEFLNFVVDKEKLSNCLFNVILVDNNYIHKINKEYRNIDRPTDVISFALEDDKNGVDLGFRVLGDIYISLDKVEEQSKLYNHSYLRELNFLAIHGLLHLLGYDHMEKDDVVVMFKKQEELLNEAGIKK